MLRLSTDAGDILDDAVPLPRGLARKVLDVSGERLPGAEGTAQDFMMVNGPVFQARRADAFLRSLKPFRRKPTLAVHSGESWEDGRVRAVDPGMWFSVWTGLAAHQPLGDNNRARRDIYRPSAEYRARFNGCPIHETPA